MGKLSDKIKQIAGASTTDLMSQKAITDLVSNKVDKVNGKGLSTNDYDTLAAIEVSQIANTLRFSQFRFQEMRELDEIYAISPNFYPGTIGITVDEGFQGETCMTFEWGFASDPMNGANNNQDMFQRLILQNGQEYYRVGKQGDFGFAYPEFKLVSSSNKNGTSYLMVYGIGTPTENAAELNSVLQIAKIMPTYRGELNSGTIYKGQTWKHYYGSIWYRANDDITSTDMNYLISRSTVITETEARGTFVEVVIAPGNYGNVPFTIPAGVSVVSLTGKNDVMVNGVGYYGINFKTINNQSISGTGNISINATPTFKDITTNSGNYTLQQNDANCILFLHSAAEASITLPVMAANCQVTIINTDYSNLAINGDASNGVVFNFGSGGGYFSAPTNVVLVYSASRKIWYALAPDYNSLNH